MDMHRDFTDPTVQTIDGVLAREIIEGNCLTTAVDWSVFTGDLGAMWAQVCEYLQNLCDINKQISTQHHTIVQEVRSAELIFQAQFLYYRQALDSYCTVVENSANALDEKFPLGFDMQALKSSCALAGENLQVFRKIMRQQFENDVQAEMARMRDPQTGEYDWEYIQFLFESDPDDLSEAQYAALLYLYLEMPPPDETNDRTVFINLGYGRRTFTVMAEVGRQYGLSLATAVENTPGLDDDTYAAASDQIAQINVLLYVSGGGAYGALPVQFRVSYDPVHKCYIVDSICVDVAFPGLILVKPGKPAYCYGIVNENQIDNFHHEGSILYLENYGAKTSAEAQLAEELAGIIVPYLAGKFEKLSGIDDVFFVADVLGALGNYVVNSSDASILNLGYLHALEILGYSGTVTVVGGRDDTSDGEGENSVTAQAIRNERNFFLRTQGFLNHYPGLSGAVLTDIVIRGECGDELTPEEREIYDAYIRFYEGNKYYDYVEKLEDRYTGEKPFEDLTREELFALDQPAILVDF